MYRVLVRDYGGERQPGEHPNTMPEWAADFFCWSICRNPYSRAVSIWRMLSADGDPYRVRERIGESVCADLALFAEWLADHWRDGWLSRFGPLVWPQAKQIGHLQLDAICELELLNETFIDLPFVRSPVSLPRLGATTGGWLHLATSRVAAAVERWAADDFTQLGYSRLLGGAT